VEANTNQLRLTATVDWSAALMASLVAGAVSYLAFLFLVPKIIGAGNAAIMARYLASVLLGPAALAPPATFEMPVFFLSLLVHFTLALIEGLAIAFVLHRWGLFVGILGGAILGLFLFLINFYSLTVLWPHMFALAHESVALVHVVFGATAGGIYELLELEPEERLPVAGEA